jgi:hypothetical protein
LCIQLAGGLVLNSSVPSTVMLWSTTLPKVAHMLLFEAVHMLHSSMTMQDLLKRLLQKCPNKRISFHSFFAHPFLSERPLVAAGPVDATHEIIVEEPSAPHMGAVEEDYVILSIPTPPAATAHASSSFEVPPGQAGACTSPRTPGTLDDSSITRRSGRWQPRALPQQPVSQQERLEAPLAQQWMLTLPEHLQPEEALYVAALSVAELAGAPS